MLFFKKKEKVPVSTQNIDVYQEKQLELEETVFDTKQTNVDTLDSANIELSEPDNADSCLEGNVPVNNGNMENTNGKLLDSNSTNKIIDVISNLQEDSSSWVDLARIGVPLSNAGINYKNQGFEKLKPFLEKFKSILEFREELVAGKPPVYYVRPRNEQSSLDKNANSISKPTIKIIPEKKPTEKSKLFKWASISDEKIKCLSNLALDENWDYGKGSSGQYPILIQYLKYTFQRLCFENKVLLGVDDSNGDEYAAFNTGLVDKTYEDIYALFKKNTRDSRFYWYLLDFVVKGENIGKTLVRIFNPLPARANYFENKIQNMLYDTSTGELACDYGHIIVERTERFPIDFFKENCSDNFLKIDGKYIDDVYEKPIKDEDRVLYFKKLGEKINMDKMMLKRLKNRVEDAVNLAIKRVEWNYKTAIPTYYPTKNTGSLLLPLCLIDDQRVDLALVVVRQPSGAYQGETVLPLNWAYSNSRLITRPDSDWLRTDNITSTDTKDFDNELDDSRETPTSYDNDIDRKQDLKLNCGSLNEGGEKVKSDFNALNFSNSKSTITEIVDDTNPKIKYPKSFRSEYNYLRGYEITECYVSDVKVSQKHSQIIVNFIAKKISDKKGETSNKEIRFNYKVKDSSGVVISKGYWVEYNIYVGDTVRGSLTIEDIPAAGCILEFFDFVS